MQISTLVGAASVVGALLMSPEMKGEVFIPDMMRHWDRRLLASHASGDTIGGEARAPMRRLLPPAQMGRLPRGQEIGQRVGTEGSTYHPPAIGM
jgi:hypothetical protein